MRKIFPSVIAIWLLGLVLIAMLGLQARSRVRQQKISEGILRKNAAEIASAHADLTRFADVAAHHLMEPTRRLASYTQLLEQGLAAYPEAVADQELRENMHYLGRDAARLRDLVRDIQLYLAAAQPRGEVQPEDANQVVAKIEQRLAEKISQTHASIQVQALPWARLDRQRLSDLFLILIENALDHGRPLDEVIPPQILVSGERRVNMSRFFITDNGPGIPMAYRERVFDIFETMHGAVAGSTGIGLSIARRIVESRHGKIWIEDAPTGGTTFVFELPDGESS